MDLKGISKTPGGLARAEARLRAEPGEADRFERLLDREVKAAGSHYIKLGTVTRQHPTVSDLLIRHPEYGPDCWSIIHAAPNRTKPFTRIRPGTDIYLDPATKEIVWGKDLERMPDLAQGGTRPDAPAPPPVPESASLAEDLVSAVRPYLGKPYEEVNCYELLVHGLQELGVRYAGKGGLGYHLIGRARGEGLPLNAFMNGEGLVATSGTEVYTKSLLSVRDPAKEAEGVIGEITPLLAKGDILSFSLHSRGHTGIVSRQGDDWTFINSGRMDHAVEAELQASPRQQVGEEYLEQEIRHWLRQAAERNESLVITLGRLKAQKLAAFRREGAPVSRKA